MDDFRVAQERYNHYERTGHRPSLEEAITLLNDLIKEGGPNSHRAIAFKHKVITELRRQLKALMHKYYPNGFEKHFPKSAFEGDNFVDVLQRPMSEAEQERYFCLIFVFLEEINHPATSIGITEEWGTCHPHPDTLSL